MLSAGSSHSVLNLYCHYIRSSSRQAVIHTVVLRVYLCPIRGEQQLVSIIRLFSPKIQPHPQTTSTTSHDHLLCHRCHTNKLQNKYINNQMNMYSTQINSNKLCIYYIHTVAHQMTAGSVGVELYVYLYIFFNVLFFIQPQSIQFYCATQPQV